MLVFERQIKNCETIMCVEYHGTNERRRNGCYFESMEYHENCSIGWRLFRNAYHADIKKKKECELRSLSKRSIPQQINIDGK